MTLGNAAFLAVFGAIVAGVSFVQDASAGPLTDDSISVYFAQPDVSTPYTGVCGNSPSGCFSPTIFTVGAGTETTFYSSGPVANINFSDDKLVITWTKHVLGDYDTAFQGFVFTDKTSNFSPIASIHGLHPSLVSESGDQLYVNLGTASSGFNFTIGRAITVNFRPVPSGAPEPSTWAMMLLGVGAVGGAIRRGRRTHSVCEIRSALR